jgi:hypothetical protein
MGACFAGNHGNGPPTGTVALRLKVSNDRVCAAQLSSPAHRRRHCGGRLLSRPTGGDIKQARSVGKIQLIVPGSGEEGSHVIPSTGMMQNCAAPHMRRSRASEAFQVRCRRGRPPSRVGQVPQQGAGRPRPAGKASPQPVSNAATSITTHWGG